MKHFDSLVTSIIEYGLEIWSLCSSYDSLETVYLRCLKSTLSVRLRLTPTVAVLGDLGRYPLNITLQIKVVTFWCKLVTKPTASLSKLAYTMLFSLKEFGFLTWLDHIYRILKKICSHTILIQYRLRHMKSSAS